MSITLQNMKKHMLSEPTISKVTKRANNWGEGSLESKKGIYKNMGNGKTVSERGEEKCGYVLIVSIKFKLLYRS